MLGTKRVDVVIVGAGPSGCSLTLATWLARTGVETIVVEKNSGPVTCGHADGLEPRTWEILDSFGLAAPLWDRASKTVELSHWVFSGDTGIQREARRSNAAIGVSRYTEGTLHQGHIEKALLSGLDAYPNVTVMWNSHPVSMNLDEFVQDSSHERQCHSSVLHHPISLEVSTEDEPPTRVLCDYVVGCDGARSWTRKHLGIPFDGKSDNSVWGVIDLHPDTNFPDIRNRCIVEGGKHGTLMTIPREDHLVRLYVQLDHPAFPSDPSETTGEKIIAQAQHIFWPYKFQTARVDWVSTYRPGRRVAERATCTCNRVFLCGDALHCQSSKSGMGMNSSIQDAYNLGWKPANVVKGQSPARLLSTYSNERLPVAHQLQAFDGHFSRKFIEGFSSRGLTLDESIDEEDHDISGTTCNYTQLSPVSWAGFQGLRVDVKEEISNSPMAQPPPSRQCLQLGSRIPDVQIVNHCGGDSTWLHRTLRSTGQWHLLVFAGNIATDGQANQRLHGMIEDPAFESLASKREIVRIMTIHASLRREIEITELPMVLRSTPGGPTLDDDRVYTDVESYHHGHGRAYRCLFGGEDGEDGEEQQRLVLLRPDSHVAFVGGFDDVAALSDLLAEWTIS